MNRRAVTAAGYAVAIGVALWLPSVLGAAALLSASLSLVFAIAALSVVMLTGWTGQTSLAQVTFMGVGAYAVARLMGPEVGLPLYIAVPFAMVAGAVVSVLIGLPALRLRGIYLAIVTLGFAQVMQDAVFNNLSITKGQNGLYVARPVLGPLDLNSDRALYFLLLGVLCACCLFVAALRRSTLGRRMVAVSASEIGAAVRGVRITAVKLLAFALAAAVAALAGGLFAVEVQSVGPASFNPLQSIFLLGLVVIAGQRSVGGAVLAGVLYGTLPSLLTRLFSGSGAEATNLVAGIGLLLVLVGREQLRGRALRIPRPARPAVADRSQAAHEVLRDATA
jgi:branched-chain amino acid transport system permease protein